MFLRPDDPIPVMLDRHQKRLDQARRKLQREMNGSFIADQEDWFTWDLHHERMGQIARDLASLNECEWNEPQDQ